MMIVGRECPACGSKWFVNEDGKLIPKAKARTTLRLSELLNEFSDALEAAVKIEPNLMCNEDINKCINKITRVVSE